MPEATSPPTSRASMKVQIEIEFEGDNDTVVTQHIEQAIRTVLQPIADKYQLRVKHKEVRDVGA